MSAVQKFPRQEEVGRYSGSGNALVLWNQYIRQCSLFGGCPLLGVSVNGGSHCS